MPQVLFLSFLLVLGLRLWLRHLNLRHLRRHGSRVPEGFEGFVDPQALERSAAYTLSRSRVGLVESLAGSLLLVLFLFGGLLPRYDAWVSSLADGSVSRGVLFFLGLFLAQALLDIPFSLYRTFSLEERFGFNPTTPGLWAADLGKSLLIGALLLGALAAGAFSLIEASPQRWWLWVWAFLAVAGLFLIFLSPYVIEPLFFKFEPVRDEGLKGRIASLMSKAGLEVGRVQQVDASRRSRHANAYFTGLGRVKRIVLFDTLLEQMTGEEVLAVLAHEIGHWKKGHVIKRLLVFELVSLAVCWIAFSLLSWVGLPALVGLAGASLPARLVILGFLGSLAAFFFSPLSSGLSRRDEWQADRYAAHLTGEPRALASTLARLSRENLANLHPHPLYAWFYYSHPPVAQRVRRLLGAGNPSVG